MKLGHSTDDVSIPALIRQARGTYSLAIRIRLSAEGLSDLPKNGPYIIGGLANGVSASQLVKEMGLSDAQSERLLGALLEGNFVEASDNEDEDVFNLQNTERGMRAAQAIGEAIHSVDHELSHLLSPEELRGFRAGLIALSEMKARTEDSLR